MVQFIIGGIVGLVIGAGAGWGITYLYFKRAKVTAQAKSVITDAANAAQGAVDKAAAKV